MLKVRYLTKFKKDTQRLQKQHKDMDKLKAVIDLLVQDIPLPEIYRDHPLHNSWQGFRDCHIEPDWILIYQKSEDTLTLVLARSGSHSELGL